MTDQNKTPTRRISVLNDVEQQTILSMAAYWDEVVKRENGGGILSQEMDMIHRKFGSRILFMLADYVRIVKTHDILVVALDDSMEALGNAEAEATDHFTLKRIREAMDTIKEALAESRGETK